MKQFYSYLSGSLLFASLWSSHVVRAQGPTVVGASLSPARNAVAAPRTAPVVIPFSQAIDPATASSIGVFSSQYRGRRTVAASASGSAVTLAPTAPVGASAAFKPGETVLVTVPATVRGASTGAAAASQVYQFTAAASGGSARFLPGSDPVVGSRPQCVVLGDVDGDGDLDLLTANSTAAGTVSVRFNNGAAVFGGGAEVAVGSYPASLVLGDVDGDGDLDLVVANAGAYPNYGNTVSVRLNNGAGVFAAPAVNPNPTVGSNPQGLALGDVDADGDLDLLTSNYASRNGTVSIRRNDGTGNFTAPATNAEVAVGHSNAGITLGDLDGDGDLEFMTANTSFGSTSIGKNDGAGNFTVASNGLATGSGVGGMPNLLVLGDVDGDGDLDVISPNASTTAGNDYVVLTFNEGQGLFQGIGYGLTLGLGPAAVALADVDGDGDLDLVGANTGSSTVSVRLNNGHAVFTASPTLPDVAVGPSPISLAVGDLDGDGDLDLVTANPGTYPASGNTVSIRLNALANRVVATSPGRNALAAARAAVPAITFSQPVNPATLGGIRLHSAQGAGQRLPALGSAGGSTVELRSPATGNPAFWPGETVQVSVPATVGSTAGTAAVPHVFEFTVAATRSAGSFAGGTDMAVGVKPRRVAVGDVDGDGDLDLLAANTGTTAGSVSLLRNNGAGNFGTPTAIALPDLAASVLLADLDNDGDLDLLAGHGQGISIRLNNGTGTFSGTLNIALNDEVDYMAVGDVDGDGYLDLAFEAGATDVAVAFNNGSGVLGSSFRGIRIGGGVYPTGLSLADVDNDGDLDLLVAAATSNGSVNIRLNDGTGDFYGSTSIVVGGFLAGMAVGDVDGDGDSDFLVGSGSGAVYLRLNDGTGTGFTGSAAPLANLVGYVPTLADVDGDGDLDLITSNSLTNVVETRLNNGSGSFSAAATLPVGTNPQRTVLADVDGDGDLDLLVPNRDSNTLSLRLNDGTRLALITPAARVALQLFPNPVSAAQQVYVRCPMAGYSRDARVTVLNALGQVVAEAVLPPRAGQVAGPVSTAGLRPGLYTVRVAAGSTTASQQLVIE